MSYTYCFLSPKSFIFLQPHSITLDKAISIHRVIVTLNVHAKNKKQDMLQELCSSVCCNKIATSNFTTTVGRNLLQSEQEIIDQSLEYNFLGLRLYCVELWYYIISCYNKVAQLLRASRSLTTKTQLHSIRSVLEKVITSRQ